MNGEAVKLVPSERLRVALRADSSPRRLGLSKILCDAGYILVDTEEVADVVLADGNYISTHGKPVVILGNGDRDAPGLLSRNANANQIAAALRAVVAGLIVRCPDADDAGFEQLGERDALLTPRELEVLSTIVEGLTNKAIARRLNISLHTVKFHVESVFRKLGVRTRAEAVAKALHSRHLEMIKL